jgi:hypothetical protein
MSIENSTNELTDHPNIPTAWNEANIINQAVDDRDITTKQASETIYEKLIPKILHTKMFVELPPERLREMDKTQGEALLDLLNKKDEKDRTVLTTLSENNISLAIAMQEGFDKDALMVKALKSLNNNGIKPTLWLVLDDTLGYWTNKSNVKETVRKLERMIAWSEENDIEIDKIGLDYEPPIQMLKLFNKKAFLKLIDEKKRYNQKVLQNEKDSGDVQEYIDKNLDRIMNQYDIGIETYVPAKPLRKISKKLGLILDEKENTNRVPMTYTSASKIFTTLILNTLDESDIPALGIIGSDPYRTPGRDLKESKDGQREPESHLSLEELTFNFNQILGRENPFRRHNVFALDGVETLQMVLQAREKATEES